MKKGLMRYFIITSKHQFYTSLHKFGENHFFVFLQCIVTALPVDVFAFVRNALVCEIWTRKDRHSSSCTEIANMLTMTTSCKTHYMKHAPW